MKRLIMVIAFFALVATLASCGSSVSFDKTKSIDVVSRESGSGTRGAFEELVDFNIDHDKNGTVDEALITSANIREGNGAVATYVLDNMYSIGYVSFTQLVENPELKALQISGVNATVANVLNKTYTLARPFNMMYVDSNLNAAEQGFVTFLATTDGLDVIEGAGAIVDRTGATAFSTQSCAAGNLVLGGSTSVEPAGKAAAEEYIAKCASAGVTVTYAYDATGSGTGITNAKSGSYHIGFASRELTSTEEVGIMVKAIAMDGIAVVVNKDNPLSNITLANVKKVYTGTITTWADLIS